MRWDVVLPSGSGAHARAALDLLHRAGAVVLRERPDRALLARCLDVLDGMSRNPENAAAFAAAPGALVDRLCALLFVPRNNPVDGYAAEDPRGEPGVARVQPYPLYDSTDEAADLELRDGALAVLSRLCRPGAFLRRLSAVPGIVPALLGLLSTKAGRADARDLALELVAALADQGENREEFRESRRRIMCLMEEPGMEAVLLGQLGGKLGLLE